MDNKKLIEKAVQSLKYSYSPYSGFSVGTALLTKDGNLYTGCNIENASYSATVCAERTAFFSAISNGEKNFLKIAIVGGKYGKISDFCYPCGVCRQVMNEFCHDDFEIILFNGEEIKTFKLGELLPYGFGSDNLC